jgi:hypothetical protein
MVEVKQGSFYLGGSAPPATDPSATQLMYDARNLTTHGVIVGMTGSGKTGLAIDLLEEALLSGISALVIDPKGDMGNLLLNFPDLRPEDFLPWVNEGDAARKGMSVPDFAAKTATDWREGLASWGIGPDRMRRLKDGAQFAIYTPGSSAGIPLNVVGSLAVPSLGWDTEEETLRDEIEGFVSSLLGMAGIDADPIASREHVLLSNLVEASWRQARDMDLASLIQQVQDPPLRKLGVFELDAFFPPKDRTALAMRLNGLVASPSFAAWLEGPPLDPRTLLEPADGKPRASIISLAHLSDTERQFVITLLLSRVVTWMRGLPGTTDLRAVVYMDEVFGFAPPTAAPPSKKPILTLLKQARAFGVGMLLATQNPVDLDYKAMSNAGAWFIGRLQTDRDKARILEGLQSASGGVDVSALDTMIGGLEQRRFVLHDTHAGEPQVFQSRWAMSYLRGPLTREQIQSLTKDAPERHARASVAPAPEPAAASAPPPLPASAPGTPQTPAPVPAEGEVPVAPAVAGGVRAFYLDPAAPWASSIGAVPGGPRLRAGVVARVHLRFDDTKAGIDHVEEWEAVWFPLERGMDPEAARPVDYDDRDLRPDPPAGALYVIPEAPIRDGDFFSRGSADLKANLTRNRNVTVFRNPSLKLYSRVGESREEFATRCDQAAQAEADRDTAKIKDRLEQRRDRLAAAVDTARRQLDQARVDAKERGHQELLAGAGSVLSILLGGRSNARSMAGRVGGALGGASSRRSMKSRAEERERVAGQRVAGREEDLRQLEQEILDDVAEIDDRWRQQGAEIEEIEIGLESADVQVDELALVWIPTA